MQLTLVSIVRPPARLAIALVLLLAFPAVTASGFYQQDGTTYYMAVGEHGSGSYAIGSDYGAETVQDLPGCIVVKLRPDTDRGRVQLLSSLGGAPFQLEMSEMVAPPGMSQGAVAVDVPVDGSRVYGSEQHPLVQAEIATWGHGIIDLGNSDYEDPATGNLTFQTSMWLTHQGYRDDVSRRIMSTNGSAYAPGAPVEPGDDVEVHLRIGSMANGTSPPHTERVFEPSNAPLGYHMPAEEFGAVHSFQNVRFGANATVALEADSPFLGLDVDLTFRVRDPAGRILHVAEWTRGTVDGEFTFENVTGLRLDRFGAYQVEVTGRSAAPFAYSVTFHQEAAEPLDLHLWWESASFGSYAPEAVETCANELALGEQAVAQSIVPRPDPPRFPVATVVLTTIGIIAALLVVVKMTMMARPVRAEDTDPDVERA